MGLPGSPGSQHVDEKRAEVLHKVAAPGGKQLQLHLRILWHGETDRVCKFLFG